MKIVITIDDRILRVLRARFTLCAGKYVTLDHHLPLTRLENMGPIYWHNHPYHKMIQVQIRGQYSNSYLKAKILKRLKEEKQRQ